MSGFVDVLFGLGVLAVLAMLVSVVWNQATYNKRRYGSAWKKRAK